MTEQGLHTPPEQPVPQSPQPAPSAGQNTEQNERTWAMLTHLAAFGAFIGVPFGNIVGPLVVWLIKKDTMPLVDKNGKESLNFQITMSIATLICIPLVFIIIGIFLIIALSIFNLVVVIIATVKTNNGEDYKYPFSFKFFK